MAKDIEGGSNAKAPKSGESEISTEVQKRRRRRRPKSTGDAEGIEDVPPPSDGKLSKSRRPKSTRPHEKSETTGGSGSVLFTILTIGLVFSLIDVVYIIGFVDRQNLGESRHELLVAGISSEMTTKEDRADGHPPPPPPPQATVLKRATDDAQYGDKAEIISLLTRAGVTIDKEQDKDLIDDLPTWSEVVGMYGPNPVVYGLDQCEAFQHQSDPALHFLGVAGTFNTGTNLLAELLIANCHMQARMDKFGSQNRGIRWQVPWGKHTPPGDEDFRQSHKTDKDKSVDANNILAAATIRDPLVWLGSMCRHAYAANWDHGEDDRCPDFSLPDLKTTVKYAAFEKEHESILHLWNAYYLEYQEATFPRLLVRYEDLIFHPEEVTRTVCECAGGSMRKDGSFKYIVDSAKKGDGAHGKTRTGYADALVKYGSEERRYQIYHHASDLEYIRDNVDAKLMQVMNYPYPDPTKANVQ
eukprot:CAMPEP_0117079928 /NCGR_PEP_ID=MMETSP0472-20121206/56412_1 /TAXON_ID=693140 ORGANISM="Tiarina fusus, Strain LIS" /NCGR_SAMPLE_ID=MMETSP0472 /ASSEMBLY_ACC=CAM_ASM_000603 /LENGTH=469 /DNA_ID=CAMNT_0004807395 /DNA_START=40 /DNA_END=1449 /DNA_ORIENTATION=+